MTPRKLLLIVMLAALAASALMGIMAILVTSDQMLARLLGTSIATAVAAGLLLPASLLTDRPKLRAGGLAAMGVILLSWVFVLALIWLDGLGLSSDLYWRIGASWGFLLLTGIPAAGVLLLQSVRWARVAVWLFVAMAVYAYLVCLAGAWVPASGGFLWSSNHLSENLWGTAMIPYGIGTVCALLMVNFGCGDRRYFRFAGLLFGLAAMVIGVIGVWTKSENEFWGRVMGILVTLCILLAHINLLLMARLKPGQSWLMWTTMGCSASAALCMILFLITQPINAIDDAMLGRFTIAGSIATACGSLALIVVSALNRRVDRVAPVSMELKELALVCPRCGVHQSVPMGESACKACHLQFVIRVIEPLCPVCGYNLYCLTSDRCPECGTPVRPGAGRAASPALSAVGGSVEVAPPPVDPGL